MLYEVTHKTCYSYEAPVSQSIGELHLTPRTLSGQRLEKIGIAIQPSPLAMQPRKDYFGNEVTAFTVFETHDRFVVSSHSIVEVVAPPAAAALGRLPIAWEDAREMLATQPDSESLDACEFVFDSPFVSADPEFERYARPTFTPGRPLAEALGELSHRIHTEFRYLPESTSIDMPLLDVLKTRRGVCQDFAHVMIAALRSLRLAARYVSGYLRSGGEYQGAGASHAWVAAFVPGSGWLSYDPTNDMMPSDGHITLAWGRDYGDVTPVKGVTLGGGEQTVEVEVYMRAVQPSRKP